MKGQKIVETTVRFSFEKRIETTNRLPTMKRPNKLLKQRLAFPIHKRIKTTDRLLTMQGQKIVALKQRLDFPLRKGNNG